ncbi:threonine-phosphate decarboxylase CobD [Herminiimonas fonticola]|uniref:threonine-phosphate decarboxylase CobD n=1 Tax=Herminiimonas fonticola TaxID=303380 RepID=UPI00333E6ADF
MLEHGGNLNDAVRRYGRPREEWLDLSTGINPQAYPVPQLTPDAWHRLPEPSTTLLEAAQTYYGAPQLLPVAGTQAAIQTLPRLRARSRVVIAAPSYAEHSYQWRQAGHDVREVTYDQLEAQLEVCDVMSLCNPNNPTGEKIAPEALLRWAEQLAARGGWLIVDEAFGDTAPEQSVAVHTSQAGLIVFRSVGKFFGLAGLRLGFVAAHADLLKQLADLLGPWTVSGPAQQIGSAALSDQAWQQAMRSQLHESGMRLQRLLASHGIASHGTALYQYWPDVRAAVFAEHMAQHGIWVRIFSHGVRIGLPADEKGWQRLQQALSTWAASIIQQEEK